MTRWIAAVGAALLLVGCSNPLPPDARDTDGPQGWGPDARKLFYAQDQGSRIMPEAWLRALALPDGKPFLGDRLARYGYIANDADPGSDLPIGFTVNGEGRDRAVGMTCAACHTREIEYRGTRHRIDGGPAIVDFEAFLKDLRNWVAGALARPPVFAKFADKALGAGASPAAKDELRNAVAEWQARYAAIVDRSLPGKGAHWGLGRLDAISMIFNRVAGLDVGAGPNGVIPRNIAPADAPARYPFVWNAARQDLTQWPGFAANGDRVLGLARNLGEVYGVFADFRPRPDARHLLGYNYIDRNSANFEGLRRLERLIEVLKPPPYPWPIDTALAKRGEAIFGTSEQQRGECWSCHGIRPGKDRLPFGADHGRTWRTRLSNEGTDTRQYAVLARRVDTGNLTGAGLPLLFAPLTPDDTAFNLLRMSVVGGILQKYIPIVTDAPAVDRAAEALSGMPLAAARDREGT